MPDNAHSLSNADIADRLARLAQFRRKRKICIKSRLTKELPVWAAIHASIRSAFFVFIRSLASRLSMHFATN